MTRRMGKSKTPGIRVSLFQTQLVEIFLLVAVQGSHRLRPTWCRCSAQVFHNSMRASAACKPALLLQCNRSVLMFVRSDPWSFWVSSRSARSFKHSIQPTPSSAWFIMREHCRRVVVSKWDRQRRSHSPRPPTISPTFSSPRRIRPILHHHARP